MKLVVLLSGLMIYLNLDLLLDLFDFFVRIVWLG